MHVFQFYKKHWQIPKKYYTTETRKAFQEWNGQLLSQAGYVTEDKLLLPMDRKSDFRLNQVSCVIIQDIMGYNSAAAKIQIRNNAKKHGFPDWFRDQQLELTDSKNAELATFNLQARNWNFEIFSIKKGESGELELHLNSTANEYIIGYPKRHDHKLYVLRLHEPIKILINGKTDFTMSGRKERSYNEYEYIIEYLGEVESVEFRESNKIASTKKIPLTPGKQIDLRKVLY